MRLTLTSSSYQAPIRRGLFLYIFSGLLMCYYDKMMVSEKYNPQSLEEMQQIAAEFVSNLILSTDTATIVGLYGELGSGKTTFTQGVARALRITETVVSPTFVIEKIYQIQKNNNTNNYTKNTEQKFTHFIHIDSYRLEKSEELLQLGWKEIISNPNNLIFIEWPERVIDIMPPHIKLVFSHVSENVRELEIMPM